MVGKFLMWIGFDGLGGMMRQVNIEVTFQRNKYFKYIFDLTSIYLVVEMELEETYTLNLCYWCS